MSAHASYLFFLRHDLRSTCVFIAFCALIANFLPKKKHLDGYPRLQFCYCIFIDIVAGFGLNWRYRLPSLDLQFLGFKRPERHYSRKSNHEDRA